MKWFRRFSIIDTIALGVFFLIVGLTAFFFLRRAQYVPVTIRITDTDMLQNAWIEKETPQWYIQNLQSGLEEKTAFGTTNIKVDRVYYYPALKNVETVFVDLTIRAAFNKTTRQYTYKGTPLLVGSFQNISISGVRVMGIVTQVGEVPEETTQWLTVSGILETQNNEWIQYPAQTGFEGIKTYVADKLQSGLTVQDSQGNAVAEIISVSRTPAFRSFVAGGQVVKTPDPQRRNVQLAVRLRVREVNGTWYYQNDKPIYIDQVVELVFDDFKVTLTVQKMGE